MARVAINTGATANDGTGDTLRAAGGVINNNFLEVYTYLGAGSTTTLSAPVWSTTSVGINTLRNVGIGTTNPTSALTVTGNGTFTGVVTATTFIGALTGTATTATGLSGTPNIIAGVVTATTFVGALTGTATTATGLSGTPNITVGTISATSLNVSGVSTSGTLNVGTGGTVITTVTTGLVGIGTTNPRFALEVGAVGASGTTLFVNGDARITGILTIGTSSITLNGSTNIINVGTGVTINGSTGIISATSIVLGGATLTGAGVTSVVAGTGITVSGSTGQVTITATGVGSSQFVVTSAGIHTLSNVGIGTTNPTSALTVTGDALVTGVVTATTFIGALTGTATTAAGLSGTPNITVGSITASSASISGNVSIGGTLTYEDVTNVDSLGIVTARTGIQVLANGINAVGIVTATSFSGDGSALTNISASKFVTTAAGIHTLSNVGIGTTNPTSALTVKGTSALENVTVSGVSSFIGAVSCASTISFGTTAYFGVNDEIVLNDKFKVYTDASNTYLKNFDTNTGGDLYIQSDVTLIQKYDGSETIAKFTEGAGVELNYQGQNRLTTIEDGVIVGNNAAGVAHIPNELRVGTVAANQSNASILIANSSGVGIGTTNPKTPLQVERYGVKTGLGTFNASAGIATDIDTFTISTTDFKTAEYTLHFIHSSNIQAQKVLVMQNGTTAYSQEYGVMSEPNLIVSVGATISSGVCKLQVTPETGISGLTTYRFTRETVL